MTRKEIERIAALETRMDGMSDDLTEIKADVKLLVAAHNRQNGFVTAVGAVGAFIGGALALAWDWLTQ